MSKELVLVTGGARAGKSAFAQDLARGRGSEVLFVATARPADDEMRRRIARHKASRPAAWATLEEPLAVTEALETMGDRHDLLILDCMTLWVSNLMLESSEGQAREDAEVLARVAGLLDWHRRHDSSLVIVTNEVGTGVVPDNALGRRYRDLLGEANRMIAAEADRVYLLVAGLPIEVKSVGATGRNTGEMAP